MSGSRTPKRAPDRENDVIYFFTLLNILNYLDRYLVAAVLPAIKSDFLLTHEQSGQLQSAFVIGYILFAPIFGYLGDRVSRPRLMAFGALLWSIATMASGLAPDYESFFLTRILVGVGEASFVTTAPGFIKDHFVTPERVNAKLALFFAAIPVGSALGYVLGGTMSAHYGWRSAFYIGGLPGLILAASILLYREPNVRSRAEIPAIGEGLRKIFLSSTIMFAIAGYTFNSFALNGIATFIVPYGVSIGFAEDQIGQYFGGILVVSGLVGTLLGGRCASWLAARSADPLRSMMLFIGILALLATPLLALSFVVTERQSFLILCFFAELLVFAGVAPVNSILVLASPTGVVTLTQGITILCLNLFGAFLAPIVIGRAADLAGLASAMQLSAVALAGCGGIWLWGAMNRLKNRENAS